MNSYLSHTDQAFCCHEAGLVDYFLGCVNNAAYYLQIRRCTLPADGSIDIVNVAVKIVESQLRILGIVLCAADVPFCAPKAILKVPSLALEVSLSRVNDFITVVALRIADFALGRPVAALAFDCVLSLPPIAFATKTFHACSGWSTLAWRSLQKRSAFCLADPEALWTFFCVSWHDFRFSLRLVNPAFESLGDVINEMLFHETMHLDVGCGPRLDVLQDSTGDCLCHIQEHVRRWLGAQSAVTPVSKPTSIAISVFVIVHNERQKAGGANIKFNRR
ncbi:hypothetical protein BGZ61DRAFT_531400 [Ilyonectria robusta]|uniref:uncharacterized protein n=1 Tax=Ilyonectria robusta TaxID=1079257 RepID=UPI001E8E643B|nr:uncharacterized protein BGZ61DRAFT_531400 [Ilyonectria robusta]KAH8706181.1 hypothetical protein BGZ61DRAFT_531400 [Ilyonectria robusta]